MSESEFYMQCEEEELAPCQSNVDETYQSENINHGSVVSQPLLAGVLQSVQIAAGGIKGQPIYITPKLVSPSSTPQPGAVQIPITIIQNSSAVPTITTVASSGVPAVGTSPSTSLPQISPTVLELPSTSFAAPSHHSFPDESKTPYQVSSIKTRAGARRSAFTSRVFQSVKTPHSCSRCNVAYKLVHDLRGYMCHCNPELINSVHALTAIPRKKYTRSKRSSDLMQPTTYMHKSITPPPTPSSTVSSKYPTSSSSPPCMKSITTSEIPEGVLSPGTGDYDAQGKLIILVEDFYYGTDPGKPVLIENNRKSIMMKCHLCDKKLKNNIKLMNHMRHHMEMEQQRGDATSHNMCQHCFRNFGTPFSLQCHLETVHSKVESASCCKICELSYENTPLFLHHMKNLHKPGEMPYMCQVCNFRSSFYDDVISHFRELHKDTANLLCPYCLKVFKSCNGFQLHFNKHQKKSVLHCDKCRLQFLYAKNKTEHKLIFHQTHLKPVQLLGLKPGTKITIRAYSVTKENDNTNCNKPSTDSESSTTSSIPAPQSVIQRITPAKRKPVESLLKIMTKFQQQCVPSRTWFCIECNFEIPDFSVHFPTFVRCSLCRYNTCCSRAYANHMISNHVSRKTTTKYLNLYKPCPKLGKLSCNTCDYSTEIGDLMATHLAKNPSHAFSYCRFNEGFSRGYKRFVFVPSDLIRRSHSGIVIQKKDLQVDQNSLPQATNSVPHPNPCINPPDSFAHTPSIPHEVQPVVESTVPDKNCGTQPKDSTQQKMALSMEAQTKAGDQDGGSLTIAQLKIVLCALCSGVPHAANQFDSQPEEVQSLILKRQLQLGPPKSREGLIPRASDRLAEWVLCQREQQLPIDEISIFSKAAEFMSADGGPGISYGWAVDFLINHGLSMQSLATSHRLLPHKVQDRLQNFPSYINKQITSYCLGLSTIATMDELSIFIDMEQLDPASADSSSMMSAFKLVGEKNPLLDVVIASLADGTILPTVVFIRGDPLSTDEQPLPDIILEAKVGGFSDKERLQLWFDKVWHRHVAPNSGVKGLLLIDPYRGHLSNTFLAMLSTVNTLPGIIPQACSFRLQPLEVCVGVVLREFLQARWSQHVTEAPEDLIGAMPADLALLFSAWILEMLDVLAEKPEFLQRSFEPVLNSNSQLAPGGFSDLVQNLTKALVVKTIQEQESDESEAEDKGSN
ncbi:pogo transposable element derived with ZNF domain a [Silurus meridionalis]|uniref:Pogo transposable element with ZNF domain n=1 Tax=Silurus meridionalis TaxID=175797 RepID=A0A8T0AG26_SILME|nr:hypothetical protein HF521_011512 [Silurus meridionalis]KAI5091763.1 pogo transposable element derived with ZNF domain a [Silurus meridionalis]